jgi:hypothetical protein
MPFKRRSYSVVFFYLVSTSNVTTKSPDVTPNKRTYKLGFLLPFVEGRTCLTSHQKSAHLYAQAVIIALEHLKNDKSLTFNVTWVWNDTMCNESTAIRQQVWQLNDGVDVFIGPGRSCATTSRNAVAFNKPVMSYVSKKSNIRGIMANF